MGCCYTTILKGGGESKIDCCCVKGRSPPNRIFWCSLTWVARGAVLMSEKSELESPSVDKLSWASRLESKSDECRVSSALNPVGRQGLKCLPSWRSSSSSSLLVGPATRIVRMNLFCCCTRGSNVNSGTCVEPKVFLPRRPT